VKNRKKQVLEGIDKYQSSLDPHSTALPIIEKMQKDREIRNEIQQEKQDAKEKRVVDEEGNETAERTTDIAPVQQKYLYDFFGRKRVAPTQAATRAPTQNRGFFSWFNRRPQTTQAAYTTTKPYVAPTAPSQPAKSPQPP